MSSRRKSSRSLGSASKRPILWLGGDGLPSGTLGKKLVALGHPLHWEALTLDATRSVASLSPVVVIINSSRVNETVKGVVARLGELKTSIDLVVFQVRESEPRNITKGLDGVLIEGPSLILQLKAVLSTMRGNEAFKEHGRRAEKSLKRAKTELERLRNLAVRDDLTSLYNLRFFNRTLETEHQRATRFGRCYSIIFLDLDGLREVNSRRGHIAGGQVLKQVGEFLNQRVRRIDLPARIGGDEFVIICPETTKSAARMVAERLRYGIQKLNDGQGKSVGITASIGVACFPDDGDLPEEVLQRADRALYESKALGKNRVSCWGEFDADGDSALMQRGSVHGTSDDEIPAVKKDSTVN